MDHLEGNAFKYRIVAMSNGVWRVEKRWLWLFWVGIEGMHGDYRHTQWASREQALNHLKWYVTDRRSRLAESTGNEMYFTENTARNIVVPPIPRPAPPPKKP